MFLTHMNTWMCSAAGALEALNSPHPCLGWCPHPPPLRPTNQVCLGHSTGASRQEGNSSAGVSHPTLPTGVCLAAGRAATNRQQLAVLQTHTPHGIVC